jgi:hypothetical protein
MRMNPKLPKMFRKSKTKRQIFMPKRSRSFRENEAREGSGGVVHVQDPRTLSPRSCIS